MATIVASRYAVLSVDDDEDSLPKKKKVPQKKPSLVKPQTSNSLKPNGSSKKKKKQENNQSQGLKNQKPKTGNSAKKKKEATSEQWEEWKEKDAAFVEENFEEDLSKAILLSKLDYEQKKEFYESIRKNVKAEEEKKNNAKKNKRSQKVMSLSEFNNLLSQNTERDSPEKNETDQLEESNEFFSALDEEIRTELSKEHFIDLKRDGEVKEQLLDLKKDEELNSQESLTLVLYKACIEKRDREIDELKEEIERLNIQLKNVKTRNTKLCQIIANGEMKDKAEVLMEVERLQTIRDELSTEVANLHIQLEQERSKVRQLSAEHKNKEKNKKHHIAGGEPQ